MITHNTFLWRNKKDIIWISPLIWSYALNIAGNKFIVMILSIATDRSVKTMWTQIIYPEYNICSGSTVLST